MFADQTAVNVPSDASNPERAPEGAAPFRER
jgi:hypothetical protein